MPRSGGPCTECGYPRAYSHPDCLIEAFTVEAVFINGTAMRIVPDAQVERGKVVIWHRGLGNDFLSDAAVIPSYTKVGDHLRWEPTSGSPLGDLVIHGQVVEVIGGIPLLQATHISGLSHFRPAEGAVLDTSVVRGTLRYARLHDGLPSYACYLRWHTNRSFIERGARPPFHLTEGQIVAGRGAWRERESADWSNALDERVFASEARELARRVSVVIEQDID
jgi:hypothetical protein